MKRLFIISLLLTIFFLRWPQIDPQTQLIGDGGDNYEFLTFMHLAHDNLSLLKHPFGFTDSLRYPVGFHFEYGFDGVFSVLTGAALMFIFPNLMAFNLTVLLILFLNIFVSSLVFSKLATLLLKGKSGSYLLRGLLAGLIFGASPFVMARLNGHLNLSLVIGFPVLLYAIAEMRFRSAPTTKLTGVVLGVFLLSVASLQYLILLAWIFLIVAEVTFTSIKSRVLLDKLANFYKKIQSSYLEILLASVVWLFLFWGFIKALIQGNLMTVKNFDYNLQLTDLITPNLTHIEKVATVGVVGLTVLTLYLLSKTYLLKHKLIIFVLFCLISGLSLALIKIPFYTEPSRLVVLASLLVATLACTNIKLLNNRVVIIGLLILAIFERQLYVVKIVSPPLTELTAIASLPGKAVLDIPLNRYIAQRSLLTVIANKKIVDGYFHYTANNNQTEAFLKQPIIKSFICGQELREGYKPEEVITFLKFYGINYILIDKTDPKQNFFSQECSGVRLASKELLQPKFSTLKFSGSNYDVYQLN